MKHYWAKKMGLKPEDVCLVGVGQRRQEQRQWRLR